MTPARAKYTYWPLAFGAARRSGLARLELAADDWKQLEPANEPVDRRLVERVTLYVLVGTAGAEHVREVFSVEALGDERILEIAPIGGAADQVEVLAAQRVIQRRLSRRDMLLRGLLDE